MKAKSPPSCPPESLRAVRSSHTTILRTCTDTGLLQLFAADMHHVLRICTTCGVPLRNSQRSVTQPSTRSTYAPTSLLRHGLHRARAYRQLACRRARVVRKHKRPNERECISEPSFSQTQESEKGKCISEPRFPKTQEMKRGNVFPNPL